MRSFELLSTLVLKELKVRYKGSVLGYIWALANPFAFALVYYLTFRVIMRIEMENYSIFLLSGMFPWMWLSNSLHTSTTCFRNNASLVRYVVMPRYILPLSCVTHEMIHFLLALPVLAAFILFSGGEVFSNWLWQIPLLVLLQFALLYPISVILAIANVVVQDVAYLVSIALSMLFFLTPIVYPFAIVPDSYQIYFEVNPLSSLIQLWHGVMLRGELHTVHLAFPISVAIGAAVLAYVVYARASKKVGELL